MASSACPGWQQIEWCLYVDGQHDLVTGSAQEVTFVQKEASLLTWKFGRGGGDGGRGILYHCHIVRGSNLRSIRLFFFPAFSFLPRTVFGNLIVLTYSKFSLCKHSQSRDVY